LTIDDLTKQGKRLIGYARKQVSLDKKTLNAADVKEGLEWVGMLAFSDPPRRGVADAIKQAMRAGI